MKFWLGVAAAYIALGFYVHHEAVRITPVIAEWVKVVGGESK